MPRSPRDEEFSAFVAERRIDLLRSACLLTAGDTHLAEDLVQTALARLYVAWLRVRRSGTESASAWRIVVNAHIDEVRRPRWCCTTRCPGTASFPLQTAKPGSAGVRNGHPRAGPLRRRSQRLARTRGGDVLPPLIPWL